MKLPYSIRVGSFAVGLLIVSFFLKVSCPLPKGCFADPFVIAFFAPLRLVTFVENTIGVDLSFRQEQILLIFIWFLIGSAVGLLADIHASRSHRKET